MNGHAWRSASSVTEAPSWRAMRAQGVCARMDGTVGTEATATVHLGLTVLPMDSQSIMTLDSACSGLGNDPGHGSLACVVGAVMPHLDEYEPEDVEKFDKALRSLGAAETTREFDQILMAHLLDGSYSRRDLLVAQGRVVQEKGW